MKKRSFLKILAALLGSMPFRFMHLSTDARLPQYWLWLRPDLKTTDEEWRVVFAKLKKVGIQAVLPQIYSSNEALFEIEGYTVKERWLERIIPIAHEQGIEIHAWMWTMPCNDPDILSKHPEWYVVNRKGESASSLPAYVPYYKFLCPRRPEVRSFVAARVRALAAIKDLDGIHLDYVRMPDVILAKGLQPKYDIVQDQEYPEYDYCYCDYCRHDYKELAGVDPLDIAEPAKDESWYQFRYDAVNDMVNKRLVPEARKKNKVITAAVFPNWESVRQQWHKWDLDAFLPMLYHGFYEEDSRWVASQVAKAKKRLGNKKPVYAGLFMPHFNDDSLEKTYELAKDDGAGGFALFAYKNLQEKDFASIKRMTRK